MRCIIIEDEIPAQIVLKSYLKKVPDLELIDTCLLYTSPSPRDA